MSFVLAHTMATIREQEKRLQEKNLELTRYQNEREVLLAKNQEQAREIERLKAQVDGVQTLQAAQRDSALREVSALRAELERLKPSGPVAEDVAFLEECVGVSSDHWSRPRTERARATLSRFAAGAQSAQALAEALAKSPHWPSCRAMRNALLKDCDCGRDATLRLVGRLP